MVKNKATASLCWILPVWSLSLSLSLPSRLGPIKAGPTCLSLADAIHPEGSPGPCRGWTPAVVPFSSCLQSFPTSGFFQMTQLFASGGQRIGVSASTSVLPKNTQDRSPLGWTGWISLQSKGLSRVFSNTTVQKHQFFGTQLSLWSNLNSEHTVVKKKKKS